MSDDPRPADLGSSSDVPPTRRLGPPERILLLDMWQRSGLSARDFSAIVGIARHTLFDWKRRFDRDGPAGLSDQARTHLTNDLICASSFSRSSSLVCASFPTF
jgi:hypothetical protein